MDSHIKASLSEHYNISITKCKPISGGDISSAYVIETTGKKLFCKLNDAKEGLSIFKAETLGLRKIAETQTIKTPEVYGYGKFGNTSHLLMEYVPTKSPSDKDFELLGTQLALLHQNTDTAFGFVEDDYIGYLRQQNHQHKDWTHFYIQERLQPQFRLAIDKGLLTFKDIPKEKDLLDLCTEVFLDVSPSLLHGDLWSGNYLISANSEPYLIDPAVYYGHSYVDIAMTKLFGGFSTSFYEAYHSHIPEPDHKKELISLYQLYYLLAHLNMFGASYRPSVKNILKMLS
ncbi:fructosamine kinase family protein [Sungkyunkwania multivorans]|uniref:Fructosamine kinase family protein n=1 Tax=Sungkyunkwania multivorans TaxID=1173618 RepID=A0ABW3CX77_9FLAO